VRHISKLTTIEANDLMHLLDAARKVRKHQAHVLDRSYFYGLHPEKCPHFWAHTPKPPISDERALDAWMDEMLKTHRQRECPGCGLFAIWTPRKPDEPYEEPDFQEYECI